MNCTISGWSMFSMTIFAARLVLPPDLIEPATASAAFIKDSCPDARPPPLKCSLEERSLERFVPEPEPPLKIKPSVVYHFKIEFISSLTSKIKHALHCCGTFGTPTLNQTGELKTAIWLTNRCVSS